MADRRRVLRTVLIGGAAGAVAVSGWVVPWRRESPSPQPSLPPATARIVRETLVQEARVPGNLGFGAATGIGSRATGTITWLPQAGDTIARGQTLLRADERPVVLFYGTLPMFRSLSLGTKGKDVKQLEHNLTELKFGGLTVDEDFTASTEAAVKRWQRGLGLEETGIVEPGQVVYAPGVIRVADVSGRLGGAATGDVFTYTGTTKVVTMNLPAGETAWAVKGTKVNVALPGGKTTAGEITAVSAEATNGDGADGQGAGGATVEVLVAVADQQALAAFDKAPVEVRYVAQRRENVLTVPVAALLALAEGGYGLELVIGSATRVVAVETGMAAGGRIEVRGNELAEGMTVGMPE